jgi:hypothetical protein
MYYIVCGNERIGEYESYSEAKKAKLKLEARDFINDEYEKGKYSLWYRRAE